MSEEIDFPVPSEKAVADAVKAFDKPERDYVNLPPNLVENRKIVSEFHALSDQYFQKYTGQASRSNLETLLKNCDAKYRLAQPQSQRFKAGSTQEHDTVSHVASSQLRKSVDLISSGQIAITFSDPEELPARYEPIAESSDYTMEEGKRIAEGHNLYLRWVWLVQGWTHFIKRILKFNQKNSMELLSLEWEYKTQKRPERMPGYYDSNGKPVEMTYREWNESAGGLAGKMFNSSGKPIDMVYDENARPRSYVFIEKERIIKNCPVLMRHDLGHTYFDLDMDADWPYIHRRCEVPYSTLLGEEKLGHYKNVGKLKRQHMWESASEYGSGTDGNKDDNADQTREDGKHGGFEVHYVTMLAPIVNGDDPKKAKWDKDAIPEYYEAVFCGKFRSMNSASDPNQNTGDDFGDLVPLQIRKIPYHTQTPLYYLMHSHDDERGAIHTGLYSMLECNIEEQDITLNQHIDNKTLGIKRPWLGRKGDVLSRNLKFKNGNQVIWIKKGVGDLRNSLAQAEVADMTATTIPLIEFLQKDADELVHTIDAFKGVFAGSRTTGTEYLGARSQAMKPAIEDTNFVIEPFFTWLLESVADLGRQFGNPDEMILVTNDKGEKIGEVNPTELYGQLKTRVVATAKFESDVTAKQVLINFIQSGAYDRSVQFMGQTGALHYWRTVGKFLGIPDVLKIFPAARKQVEAENQAWADWEAIQRDPNKAMNDPAQLPKEGEQHDIHNAILRAQRERFALLNITDVEYKQLVLSAVDLYILMHDQMKEAETQQEAVSSVSPTSPTGQSTSVPGMPGEAAGDTSSGLAGQMAGAA